MKSSVPDGLRHLIIENGSAEEELLLCLVDAVDNVAEKLNGVRMEAGRLADITRELDKINRREEEQTDDP